MRASVRACVCVCVCVCVCACVFMYPVTFLFYSTFLLFFMIRSLSQSTSTSSASTRWRDDGIINQLSGTKRHLVTGERLHGTVKCCYAVQDEREWIWDTMHKYRRELSELRQEIAEFKSELREIQDEIQPLSRSSEFFDPTESF